MPDVLGSKEEEMVMNWAHTKYIESYRAQSFVKNWEAYEAHQKGKEEGMSEADLAKIKEENVKSGEDIKNLPGIEEMAMEWYAKEAKNGSSF